MAEPFVSPAAAFSFGRLFADAGRVLARGWLALALGVLMLGIAPHVATGLPWWSAPLATPEAERIALDIVMVKTAINLITTAALTAVVAAVSLKVLQGVAWGDTFDPATLALGAASALCASLLVTWPGLVIPLVGRWLPRPAVTALVLSGGFLEVALVPFFGVATLAAVSERRFVASAFARSVRLLRGLRWRMAALAAGYVAALYVTRYLVQIALVIGGDFNRAPRLAQIAVNLSSVLVGVLAAVVFASVFIQSRRIADGPAAAELHDIFG